MGLRLRTRLKGSAAALAMGLVVCALALPAGAGAATVVNGDFETGNLSGWQLYNQPPSPEESGNWFAYTGTTTPDEFSSAVPAPPAGKYAAVTNQGGPGLHILYQDVALEPYYSHQLSMLVYYQTGGDLFSPNNFVFNEPEDNQQYRVDVMKPSAAIESLSPADILATAFATATGGASALGTTPISLDLTPFAGQTVRLRFAEVDNQEVFNAAVDSVAIQSTPPSNAIALGKVKLNKKNGTAKLSVTVPGAGSLKVADVKKKKKRLKTKVVNPSAAGSIKLPLQATGFGRKGLAANGKLQAKLEITFTPTGGVAAAKTKTVVLKLKP